MADLFTVTAPLRIQIAKQTIHLIAELYPHPDGLVYLDAYWNDLITKRDYSCIHIIKSELKGAGPWKIANNVIHVLGCFGTDARLAQQYANWSDYCIATNIDNSRAPLNKKLLEWGVEKQHLRHSNIVYLDVNNSSK